MKSKIKMAVACGGGIFTTTVVTDKIKDILKKEKFSSRSHHTRSRKLQIWKDMI
ncbi:MAG: hypothetical protein ACLR2O_08740 [Coprococcus sp.]